MFPNQNLRGLWCVPYPEHIKKMINEVENKAKKELNAPEFIIYRGSEVIPNFDQFYKKNKKGSKGS